ncbi:MAG TPA: hypothetical protein VGQ36_14020 [Thermoanaerobaculia bacterium]|nr:hypothetical protein [Thermoanaerobaculia bacterium]
MAERGAQFNETRDTEFEHANLFLAASRQLESMNTEKTFFVCDRYTIGLKMPLCALGRTNEHPRAVE